MVFKIKENSNGSVNLYKAWLVVNWFHQCFGYDFNETFSSVVKPTTIRLVLTITISNGWYMCQLDVNNAFLNDTIREEIYMVQP